MAAAAPVFGASQGPVDREVKRLEPTKDTIRELFAKSGNQCAFPGCNQLLIDANGDFIAQVCHIEAAEEGGERFNKTMTNEQRRHVSNLMIMCYPHHVKTDDVDANPTEKMKKMKADHEAKYLAAPDVILKSIVDSTTVEKSDLAKILRRINTVLEWGHTDEQLAETLKVFDKFQRRLKQVPRPTREILHCHLALENQPVSCASKPASAM